MRYSLLKITTDIRASISHYIEQLMFGAYIKVSIATIVVFFAETLYVDIVVFNIYVAFACCDLFLGVLRAKLYGKYKPKYLLYWVRKMLTHLFLIMVLGLICHAMFRTSGIVLYVVNWLLLCCIITEGASIIDNLRRLGCPIHPVIDKIIKILRKQATKSITRYVGDAELRREIDEVLGEVHKPGQHPDE